MSFSLNKMRLYFIGFKSRRGGALSVEFALIAPVFIFSTLYAVNLSHKVNQHQRLAGAVAAGTNYLQDYMMEGDVNQLRGYYNINTQKYEDGTLIKTTKLVVQDAFGEDLPLDSISINTFCGCPQPQTDSDGDGQEDTYDFTKSDSNYYQKHRISPFKFTDLCPLDCPQSDEKPRVLVDIFVTMNTSDAFANEIIIKEKLTTRVR